MSSPTGIKSHQSAPHESWKQQHNVVTHNDVIDAYLMGKKDGRNEWQKAMLKLFEDNLKKAREASEQFYVKLLQIEIGVCSVHLKAENLTNFIALIIVDLNDYVSEKFLEGIGIGKSIKDKVNSDDFSIDFIYTYKEKSLSEKSLNSDGYFTKYGHK